MFARMNVDTMKAVFTGFIWEYISSSHGMVYNILSPRRALGIVAISLNFSPRTQNKHG